MNKNYAGWWGFPLAVTIILTIGVGTSLLLSSLGWPIMVPEAKPTQEPKAPERVVSQWAVSPAMKTLTASLEDGPNGWEGNGEIITSPQTPYPFSCVAEGINPAISLSKNFTVDGDSVQVVTTAYTAGLGAAGLEDKFNNAPSCAGGDAYYTLSYLDGLGAEAYQADIAKSNLKNRTIIWRYGDIVTYLITDNGSSSAYSFAQEFNANMLKKLDGACLAENYQTSDLHRTPFSGVEYEGYFTDKKVTIEKRDKPEVPEDANFEPTKIPAPSIDVKDVTRPVKPTAYPVWPELPEKMPKPTAPDAPPANAPYKDVISVKTKDVQGPGCGWDFTGSTAPDFDEEEAEKYNSEKTTQAKSDLNKAAEKWQKSVLEYWKSYDEFKEKIPAWNNYVSEVKNVAQAWAEIETDWANYYQAKDAWDAQVAAREDFLARQEAAQQSYESLQEQCKAQAEEERENAQQAEEYAENEAERRAEYQERIEAAEQRHNEREEEKAQDRQEERERIREENNSDDDESNDEPLPEPYEKEPFEPEPYQPAPAPDTTIDNPVDCPAERPAILDQAPPQVGEKPTPPEDPRPPSERD